MSTSILDAINELDSRLLKLENRENNSEVEDLKEALRLAEEAKEKLYGDIRHALKRWLPTGPLRSNCCDSDIVQHFDFDMKAFSHFECTKCGRHCRANQAGRNFYLIQIKDEDECRTA